MLHLRTNIKGLTLWELYNRKDRVDLALAKIRQTMIETDCMVTEVSYQEWEQLEQLRKKIRWAIYWKEKKLQLLSLVGRN